MLDTDAEQFDCETCPLATRLCGLDADNAEAWRVFGQLYTRLNVEWRLLPNVFERVVADLGQEDVLMLMDRLAVIFDVLVPPRTMAQED